MFKFNKIATLIAATIISTGLSAASVDFRQEYRNEQDNQDQYQSRVKIGASVGKHFFGLEAKQKGKPFTDWERGDNEFEYGYRFDLDKQWRVTPSMPITFSSGYVTFKPQVRVQYKFDSGVVAKLRYRHQFRNYAEDNSTTGRDGEQHSVLNSSKLTANLDWKLGDWQFGLEGNYVEDFINKEWKLGTNAEYEWDYNLKVGYKQKDWKWRPYFELGNIQCSSSSGCGDDYRSRQLRTRVGITYYF
ncbi:oligogalacturonate-specific porin KdgM family protein [Vibrio hippocampi]|uniref:Oligogalacturonate-specific porin KdgM n=1 Tax=Vibrio hippocampi TaxID=654686 RepID=A0ABM8ZNS9_9VIBR|nr:oligogalacturonate-specific porin KdgM family protein [Vibrio hippocampi]CAH0530321.1 Oligogalacturonate-specific porin KdgM [Vibrio hippocampi]